MKQSSIHHTEPQPQGISADASANTQLRAQLQRIPVPNCLCHIPVQIHGLNLHHSDVLKSRSAYPIPAFHSEGSPQTPEARRRFETFHQCFVSPEAGERQGQTLGSGGTIRLRQCSTRTGARAGSDVNSSPTPFPSEGSSPAGSQIKVVKLIRGSRQLPRAFCSLCICLWRGKLDDQLPKALGFGISSLEGQILPFFC